MIRKLLVANRGEIALRIIRGAREMGVATVAVHSEADRLAPHVLAADEAVEIGPAPSAESYLRIDRLIEAARATGADAVHPGYGFLSERAPFADAVEEAGLIFVGPTGETIRSMGDKTEARQRMQAAGVPIVPGIVDAAKDADEALAAAREIGFPVLLKAAAGGGGKGMRVVEEEGELAKSFEAAQREARSAFGDDSVYVEKYLGRPRHIEIQILGDAHGNVVHLHERECSIQRRHQKLVEEAPSALLTPEQRAEMGAAAVRAAQATKYRGAGTVEFLWQDGEFYFLEMNTRLQVEHPVTEFITGLDLVHWQLKVAAGEPLDFTQEEVRLQGHSIEVRVTSEDAFGGFLPSTGSVHSISVPGGPGVRWDGGITAGTEVGLHYDPLLGKLITWGPDRLTAIIRMERALDELVIRGVNTCLPFHREVMREKDFREGNLTIRYLEDHPELLERPDDPELAEVASIAAALLEHRSRATRAAPRLVEGAGGRMSNWRAFGWR